MSYISHTQIIERRTSEDRLPSAGCVPRKEVPQKAMALIIVLLMVIGLDIAAMRWGIDSTDGINSLEWLRRQQWYGFH